MTQRPLPPVLLFVPIPVVGAILCCLPLFSALICVVYSLLFDFKQSTGTECGASNYLPSISAAIGGSTPQRYVWRIGVCLHATPRILISLAYRKLHESVAVTRSSLIYQMLFRYAMICNLVEIGALIMLSYISSTENDEVHEAMFVLFMASGLLHMIFSITLFTWRFRYIPPTPQESRSLAWKKRLLAVNVSTFLVSVYAFFRHVWYCESGVYTAFAASEYIVVLTNIGFHGTLIWDFDQFSIACVNTNFADDNS